MPFVQHSFKYTFITVLPKLYNVNLLLMSYSVSSFVAVDADLWVSFVEANSDDGSRKERSKTERYYDKKFACESSYSKMF